MIFVVYYFVFGAIVFAFLFYYRWRLVVDFLFITSGSWIISILAIVFWPALAVWAIKSSDDGG